MKYKPYTILFTTNPAFFKVSLLVFTLHLFYGVANCQNPQESSLYGKGVDEGHPAFILPVPGDSALQHAKYLDGRVPLEERIDDLMSKMTDDEKAAIFYGGGEMATGNFPRLGIPTIGMADGPQGVRLIKGAATGFPSGIAMASTWDAPLIEEAGSAIGEECLAFNRRIIFGPGVNMMRSPLGGRNYEYMGEDPVLTGKIGAAYIRGTQREGVAACPKHYILNDQEVRRNTINITCDERALHEIYAKPFMIFQKEAGPWAAMSSNSQVLGNYVSESKKLLRDLLFSEIGFDGIIVSDWAAVHDEYKAINNGCTLIMPTLRQSDHLREVTGKVADGTISKASFDDGVRRMLRLYFRVGAFDMPKAGAANTPAHQQLARKVATESIVLLKNKNNILPLDPQKIKKIAVIGPNADIYHTMAYDKGESLWEKGGSGAVRPPYEISPLDALKERLGDKVLFAPGYTFETTHTKSVNDIPSAVAAAKQADVAIIFAGINHSLDGEGRGWDSERVNDRKDMELIGPQKELIDAVVKVNPRTIVVLTNGGPVSLEPWNDKVPAILEAWYGNQEAGNAIADILLGISNPSGKLPCTLARKAEDYRVHQFDSLCWPGTGKNGQMVYKESIWVGYRWFDHSNTEPLYPFGHGLSYTTFRYGDLAVRKEQDSTFSLNIRITNSGNRAGSEVVQFYVLPPASGQVERPQKELKNFEKVTLSPGESKNITAKLDVTDFSYYNIQLKSWKIIPGTYTVAAASSSRDIRAKVQVVVE